MKHIFIKIIATMLAICYIIIFPITTNAVESNKGYDWYFHKNTDNSQPALPSEFNFITKNNGYYLGNADEKVIYLTFDAGYENGNVAKILDALEKHNATGAFFILDNLINRNKELVERMINNGNLVCNHTARHPDMSAITSKEIFAKQLTDLEATYKKAFNLDIAPYYRPPQGKFNQQNLKWANEIGYKTIFWSYAYADWDNNKQPNPATSLQQILEHTHNGMVILLHPTSATNAEIMDALLTSWEQMGYRFGSLDELTQ